MASDSNPARDGWVVQSDDGFIGLVGPFWRRAALDGRARYAFEAQARHANLLSVVQGGMLMTFADRAMGLEAWAAADGRPCATIQFSAQFVATGTIGALIEIEPVVIRRTRSLVFMSGAVMQGGEVVLEAHGTWKILRA